VVLAGEVGRAGGTALQDAVSTALRNLSCLETSVAATTLNAGADSLDASRPGLGTRADDPVLAGALDAALAQVRATLLGHHPGPRTDR
jgi:hypothetical protein